MPEQIGQLLPKKTSVEWKIENFFDGTHACAKSPTFQLSDARFYIEMIMRHDNGKTLLEGKDRCVYVYLKDEFCPSDIRIEYTIRLKKSFEGSISEFLYFDQLFTSNTCGMGFTKWQILKAENLAEWSGTLVVFCEARVVDDSTAEAETLAPVLDNLEKLSRHYENIYVNGCDTDAMIEVKGKKFPAHRLILSARSSVFRSMFAFDMKEKETGSVNITDCDPESFGAFLQFLYNGKLDVVTPDNALDLYTTAEKYNVQDLKKKCSECLNRGLCVESVCDVVHFADLYGDQELLWNATIYFNENVSQILKTSKWQTLVRENFTLANDLLIKRVEDHTNCTKIYN